MNWQEIVSLLIVALTAGLFVWSKVKPRKFSMVRDTHCGCSPASQSTPQSSMVFRARRGERPQIIVKMK